MNAATQFDLAPTSLAALEKLGVVVVTDARLKFSVRREWIVEGEDRLSYGTIVRLAECGRELHWRLDVQQHASQLDSICSRLGCVFRRPFVLGMSFTTDYEVMSVGPKGYTLRIQFADCNSQRVHAEVSMECIFYDAARRRSVKMPEAVRERLTGLLRSGDHASRAVADRMHDLSKPEWSVQK